MSLVGPRPAIPYETDQYTVTDWSRFKVKPGMTGLSQIAGRAALSFHETVALDIQYGESWSLLLDLSILLRTPWVVATGLGAA
jgi:lipopolysaccharide/colanic/teichoic acid biosynthesis glycosyltransferase